VDRREFVRLHAVGIVGEHDERNTEARESLSQLISGSSGSKMKSAVVASILLKHFAHPAWKTVLCSPDANGAAIGISSAPNHGSTDRIDVARRFARSTSHSVKDIRGRSGSIPD
jgi:hypothetical protein